MKIKTVILWICLLVVLDQGVKIVINTWFFETRFTIIPSLLEFHPKFNYNHSYLNDLFKLGIGKWVHMILFFLISAFYIPVYAGMRACSHKSKLVDWGTIFGLSGIACAILSNLFWKGVLDFIYLVPLFIFDLKDIYINLFVPLTLIAILKHPKLITERRFNVYMKWQKRVCRNKRKTGNLF